MREVVKRKLRVPDLKGLLVENAEIMLTNAGFDKPVIRFSESYLTPNTVLEQIPTKGQIVDSDAAVQLTVSQKSYIRHLPSVYQRGSFTDYHFLREFLWIFQHLHMSLEVKLDKLHDYFDPHEAPDEFLPWLASWMAFRIDPNWPETKKRSLIKKAIDLYRIRGTVKGLKVFLSIFTGVEPTILENQWPFQGFRIGVHSTVGLDTVILPPVNLAHCFIVHFPKSFRDVDEDMVIRIHDIITSEKPGHTIYYLRFAAEIEDRERRDGMQIGVRAGIGVGAEISGIEQVKVFRSTGE